MDQEGLPDEVELDSDELVLDAEELVLAPPCPVEASLEDDLAPVVETTDDATLETARPVDAFEDGNPDVVCAADAGNAPPSPVDVAAPDGGGRAPPASSGASTTHVTMTRPAGAPNR